MHGRSLSAIAVLVAGGLFVACVGEDAAGGGSGSSSGGVSSASGGSSTSSGSFSSGSSSGEPGSSSGAASSSSGDQGDASTDGGSSSGSSSGDPDAGVTCIEHQYLPNTANTRCRAGSATAAGAGAIQPGEYMYTGRWNCDANTVYIYGSAQIYTENGKQRMRYRYMHRKELNSVPAEYVGTWTLEPNHVNAVLVRTEECTVPNIGFREVGTYDYNDADNVLTFKFAGHDEAWTRVP